MKTVDYDIDHEIMRVGAPRIELGLHAPEACVLPVYYAPISGPYRT